MTGQELLKSISRLLAAKIQSRIEFRHETTFSIQPEDLREVAKFCRDELSFDYLIDISSVDNFGDEPRFEVVYELYSMTLAVHLRLKLAVSEEVCAVDTVSDIWPTADWQDRKSTRLNSSHVSISYAVFCLKKKTINFGDFHHHDSSASSFYEYALHLNAIS